MATTSLWHISGRLTDVINYIENPEKTRPESEELGDLFSVIDYVKRGEATSEGEYVSAINCMRETAFEQMIMTKKQFGKTEGYIAWHGYQSFKPGEVTPEECHQIGIEYAKEMWGDRFQIIVTTHLDKDHLHNHFCFNSVSFRDGKKYNFSKKERQRMMEVSDRICKEHGLSVIGRPHKAPSRPVWLAEKAGEPTLYNIYRRDIVAAVNNSKSVKGFERYLTRLGYQLGILPEKTSYRPTSPILKEDIRKMDKISDQVRYMSRNSIHTMEDLLADRERITVEIKDLTAERTKIYNKMRRAKPEDIPALRAKRDEVSKRIETLRKDLKCNHRIEKRSTVIKDKLQTVYENELKHSISDRDRVRTTENRTR